MGIFCKNARDSQIVEQLGIDRVIVIGVGLIGGSVYKAVGKFMPECKVEKISARELLSSEENLETLQQGVSTPCLSTSYQLPGKGLKPLVAKLHNSPYITLFVIGSNLNSYPAIAEKIQDCIDQKENILITDVGSVKFGVAEDLQRKFGSIFISSHPIAGKESSGFENSEAELFLGKKVFITSRPNQNTKIIEEFWKKIGAEKVIYTSPKEHDKSFAYTSHFIQKLMFMVGDTLHNTRHDLLKNLQQNNPRVKSFLRLTHSNPEMWKEIFAANQTYITEAEKKFYSLLPIELTSPNITNEAEFLNYCSIISKTVRQLVANEQIPKIFFGSGIKSVIEFEH